MVSPELLRRYPFFSFLDDAELKAVAMIAEELTLEDGESLFEIEQPAEALYLLMDGTIELYYVIADDYDPASRKEFYISDINPGEICGISALIEPHQYTSTARAASLSHLIKLESVGLRAVCEVDPRLAYNLMRQVARAALERLHATRVQLIAARA
jgi:CRP-like cAMP-binding protein